MGRTEKKGWAQDCTSDTTVICSALIMIQGCEVTETFAQTVFELLLSNHFAASAEMINTRLQVGCSVSLHD